MLKAANRSWWESPKLGASRMCVFSGSTSGAWPQPYASLCVAALKETIVRKDPRIPKFAVHTGTYLLAALPTVSTTVPLKSWTLARFSDWEVNV